MSVETCLRPILLYLLLTFSFGQTLGKLKPLDYDFDDDTQNSFEWNEEKHKNDFQVTMGDNVTGTIRKQKQHGLLAQENEELRLRRSCALPEAAFIFKQAMIPDSNVKTFAPSCKEPDVMNLLKFQGQKDSFRRPSEFSDFENSEEPIENNGMVFKEAIGFEIPETSNSGPKHNPSQEMKMDGGIEHRAKCRLAQDLRSNRADVAIQDILTRGQALRNLNVRSRREIHYRKFRATPKPRRETFETSLEKSHAITTEQESRPQKLIKEEIAKSRRPWQEKLWDNIHRSSFAQNKQRPTSATTSSSYSWKLLHIKSRSVTKISSVPNQCAKHSFKQFFSKNRSAESQPRAMLTGHKCSAPTKSNPRPHKGHYCHYHYKNHRIREHQAFHRLKANTKQFWCTPGSPDEKLSTGQALDEDAIMSTLGMDLSGSPQQDDKIAATKTTSQTYPVWTHFQHVQNTMMETTVTPQTSTTVTACRKTKETPTTETSTMTSASTQQTETTKTQLTTYLTTINMNSMTGEVITTGATVKQEDVKDDESATTNVPPETEMTVSYVHRKRFRKT